MSEAQTSESANVYHNSVILSDKYEGEFSQEEDEQFIAFAEPLTTTLGALWDVRNRRKAQGGGA